MFDFKLIADSLPLYGSGVLVTFKLLIIALALGLALAVPLALLRVSRSPLLNVPAWLYTYMIRGTLIDITGAAKTVSSQYYLPFEAFITAGLFYLCLTFILVRLFKRAERRWLAYLAPRQS